MDWNYFVELVSTTRLSILGILLAATIVLGVAGAIKTQAFQWSKLASFLAPSANFFSYIVGYVVVAGLSATLLPEAADPAVVVTTYSFVLLAMVAKVKDQLSFLAPGLPVANWKLPLESKE